MAATLRINEIFFSLQGESTYTGLPCAFVRLTACDLRCTYCDTEYAFYEGKMMSIDAVLEKLSQFPTKLVTVTGGEPLLQANVHELMQRLLAGEYTVLLETSGAHDISKCDERVVRIMDVKCPSSDESHRNMWANISHLRNSDEVKFVIGTKEDFDWSVKTVRDYDLTNRCRVLFSPVWNQIESGVLAEWTKDSGLPIRFQTQLHKTLWGDTRGR